MSIRIACRTPLIMLVAAAACDRNEPQASLESSRPAVMNEPVIQQAPKDVKPLSFKPSEAPAPPATYAIDSSHSRVGFSVRHMMVSNTRGYFKTFAGTAFIDEANPSASKVNVEIDTGSVETGDEKRDEHLRAADFFNVKEFPKLTFKSTAFERMPNGYNVLGELTIRGMTHPVMLFVETLSAEAKDPWGGLRRGTRATTKISRKDFGLTWNKALETGGVAVGDDVAIELEVELVKKT